MYSAIDNFLLDAYKMLLKLSFDLLFEKIGQEWSVRFAQHQNG